MQAIPQQAGQPVIEVDKLVTYYGEQKILDRVSLSVGDGEIMVIMGGSGSGKSTLWRYMLGLQHPDSGCVRLFGKDTSTLSGREWTGLRQKIGVSFQGGALFNSMTVGDNVRMPLREHTKLDGLVTESRPDLQQAVVDLRHLLEQVSRYSDGILQNLDSTSRNMSEFSRQIRENPGRLIGGSVPRDTGVRRD